MVRVSDVGTALSQSQEVVESPFLLGSDGAAYFNQVNSLIQINNTIGAMSKLNMIFSIR